MFRNLYYYPYKHFVLKLIHYCQHTYCVPHLWGWVYLSRWPAITWHQITYAWHTCRPALSLVCGSSGRRRNSVHRTDTVHGQIVSCTPQQHFNTIHRPDASSITIAYYNKAHRTDTSNSTTITVFCNTAHWPETNISSTTAFYNSSQRLDTRSITTTASYNTETD